MTYDLRSEFPLGPGDPPDLNAEFDAAETISVIEAALQRGGHAVTRLGNGRQLLERLPLRDVDIVFNIAEGSEGRNRESHVPILLEMLRIPCVGADGLTLGLTLDKVLTKKVLMAEGIPTPRFAEVEDPAALMSLPLTYPLIVKLRHDGSSKGLTEHSLVTSPAALVRQVEWLWRTYRQASVFVEEFIEGQEFTVGILGNDPPQVCPVVQVTLDGTLSVRQPTIFLDLALAPRRTSVPDGSGMPTRDQVETVLYEQALLPLLDQERALREKEVHTISEHMEVSLKTLIDRVQLQFAELMQQKESGSQESGLDGRIRMLEDRLDELNGRLDQRRAELKREQHCTISNIRHLGSAWVLPHPERQTPTGRTMVSDPEIEKIAVQKVIEFEEARGWRVQSVEQENRGFDLISRKPHPEDPDTAIGVRFIEVKGRSHVAEVALTTNEYKTAERLKQDYYLYVVFNCASEPGVHPVQNPARLGWKPIVTVEHYHVAANEILKSEMRDG